MAVVVRPRQITDPGTRSVHQRPHITIALSQRNALDLVHEHAPVAAYCCRFRGPLVCTMEAVPELFYLLFRR